MKPIIVVLDVIRIIIVVVLSIQNSTDQSHAPGYKSLVDGCTHTLFSTGNPTLTRNPDGSWKVSSTEIRFNVYTSSGYYHELISTLNQQQLAAKGYMQSPNDWRIVEITGYLKLNSQGGPLRVFS